MKKKILLLTITITLLHTVSFGQLMSLGFVKNCMTYDRTSLTNELFRKHFFVVERSAAATNNPMMTGATYYSNEKDPANGEIRVLSSIINPKQITEISFVNGPKNDYSKNYTEVYNQMVSFFNNETTFKSTKYNVNVTKFTKDKVCYYVYKIKETPIIVISNYKIDDEYFK